MGSVKSTHKDVVQFQTIAKQCKRDNQRNPITDEELRQIAVEILERHEGEDDDFIRHLRSKINKSE